MSFKEVSSLDAEVTIALGKTDRKTGKPGPKQVEGYYLGSRKVATKKGESKLHFLQTSAGNLGVWGTADLNRKLGAVVPGTMVRATSTGTKPTPRGDMYTYKVEVDETNTIEVSASEDSASYAQNDSDDDSAEAVAYDDDANEDEAQAMLAAAERKAKVEALLKNTGKNKVRN